MPAGVGRYYFNNGVNCLFEMPTPDARRLLPAHLQPLEVQHERSILSVTAFDFYEGDGGIYQEAVLAILVPPRVKPGERLPTERGPGFFPGAPDLAVEVLSPSDRPGVVDEKIECWLDHGTAQVWVVDPQSRTLTIHARGEHPIRVLGEDDMIDGGSLLPGFSLAVRELFAPIAPASNEPE